MKISNVLPSIILCISGVAGLTGCASNAPYQTSTPYGNTQSRYVALGTIESIHLVGRGNTNSGAGAVVGGIVGAIVGNQVGGGTGRAVATVAGGVGGAVIGNNIENNRNNSTYQINIRLDNGGTNSVHQNDLDNLRVGDRVSISDGRAYLYRR